MNFQALFHALVASLAFAAIGILVFAIAFGLIRWIAPFSIRKEIEEDQNVALAVLIGSVLIGISLIIAAAVHG